MRKVATAAIVAVLLGSGALIAQSGEGPTPDAPWWAYGFQTPPKPGEEARECGTPWPMSCYNPRPVPQLEDVPRSLPGAPRQYSRKQASEWFGPADWYPDDHPQMPDIVAKGNESRGIRACTLCHSPLGKGRSENSSVAALPVPYFLQQLELFKSGQRRSADPRKLNTKEMIAMAKLLSPEEARAAAEYYASVKWTPRGKVVESPTVPKFRSAGGLYLPREEGGTEPIDARIIEIPDRPDDLEYLRDPKAQWTMWAPVGSIARGKSLATTGSAVAADGTPTVPGRTMQCTVCHGADLNGVGNVPPLAGRSPTYLVRQMYDMQVGTRVSPLMKPVVGKLSNDDFVALGAYLASLDGR
jgi:cytochrome c553